jgi:hypothetical protein
VSIIEEEILCSSYTCHNVKGHSTKSGFFFVFASEEKRAKWPHLLAGFYPMLGFSCHILCLFLDGMCIYLYFIVAHLIYFIHLGRKKIVIK